jgi:hypothetical protein
MLNTKFAPPNVTPNHLDELTFSKSVILRNGIEAVSASEINACFDADIQYGTRLKHLYGISASRPTAAKLGALDFVNDLLFAFPAEELSRARRLAGLRIYQYVVDEANPWQASSRAHHCVDLLLLFGGYDLSRLGGAENVGREMRDRWVRFVHGEEPWDEKHRFAFGPQGKCGEIGEDEYAVRRRVRHFEILREMGPTRLWPIFRQLAAGRISLLN